MRSWLGLSAAALFLGLLAGCGPAGAPTSAGAYTVDIQPADFVGAVDNPYFPLPPGATYVYEAATEEGLERTEIKILSDPKRVMGIPATVVHDTVTLNRQLIEDTYDWYAQDKSGNVWYLGEDVSNFEDGQFKDKAGSWEAGVDGALPGIIMFGDLSSHLGETYRQEYYQGRAEDMADLLRLDETVTVPFGSFTDVVKTLDYTPLEPDLREQKFYARGIGLVLAVNLATGEEDVLLQFSPP
jgi:hypothetical protein